MCTAAMNESLCFAGFDHQLWSHIGPLQPASDDLLSEFDFELNADLSSVSSGWP